MAPPDLVSPSPNRFMKTEPDITEDRRLPANHGLAIYFLLLSFVLLGGAYSVMSPLHEATDEIRHYRYVRYLVDNKRLPVQGQEACRSQSHHPPLFYAMAAAATFWVPGTAEQCATPPTNPFWAYRYWEVGTDNKNQYLHGSDEAFPWHGDVLAAHIARFLNILIGAATVWLTWAMARTLWPDRPGIALGGAALIAFNPMFLYLSAAINNDVIAAFSGALICWLCLRLLRAPASLNWRWGIYLGLAYGVGLLSKFNVAASGLLIGATVTWVTWQNRQNRRAVPQWLIVSLLSLSISLLIAGWWFVRNQVLYGEPTGFRTVTELWGVRDPLDSLGLAFQELPYAWTTLWGRFGFGQIPLPSPFYRATQTVIGLGLAGAIAGWLLGWRQKRRSDPAIPLLFFTTLIFFSVLFNYMLVSPAGPMGRFFFPGLPAMCLLAIYGLAVWLHAARTLIGRLPLAISVPHLPRKDWSGGIIVTVAMIGVALWALLFYLAPAYARPPAYDATDPISHVVDARFDFFVRLHGYDLDSTQLAPGEPIDLKLYWDVLGQPPGNYLLFVHVIDDVTGEIIAQRDTHPGLGRFPSSQWRQGDRFVESLRVYLPSTAYAPSTATLQIGLYAPDSYRLAIMDAQDQPIGDALPLTSLAISATGDVPNPQRHNFNQIAILRGFDLSQRRLQPGDPLHIELWWQRLVPDDYIVHVELLTPYGGLVDAVEQPLPPMSEEQAVKAVYTLLPDSSLPPGPLHIKMFLLDTQNRARQNMVGEDGHWIDDHLMLPPVRRLASEAE